MKEPSLSRLRKKPTSKLKLVCSFNGAFHVRPPSSKLRYIGGETRIISVDRTVSFSELHSKLSDICPNIRSFTLKYQLPVSGLSHDGPDADDEIPLVLIASDEDLKCMVEEYEKLDLYGKHARLWLFVCNSEIECDDKGGNNRAVKGNCENSLRKIVLKQQQLLANQSKMEEEFASCGAKPGAKPGYEHPLIDLGGNNMSVFKGMGNARLHPLNPRDGNLCVETNVPQKWLMGAFGLYGTGARTGSTGQSSMPLKETYNCGTVSLRNFNRENIMPWTMNYGPVKTHFETLSCGSQGMGSHCHVKSSYVGDSAWSSCQHGTSNFRFGVNRTRNHRIYPYSQSHRNNMVEAGNHGDVRFDGKTPVGKCYLGIRQNSNMSKRGQSMGLNNPNLLKMCPVFAKHALEGTAASCLNEGSSLFDVQYSKETFREQGVPANLQYVSSNLVENHLVYHGTCDRLHNQSFLSHDAIKSPSSRVRLMNTQEDRLKCFNFVNNEVPYQALYENFNGRPTNHEPIRSNLENDKLLGDSPEDAIISGLSNNVDYANGTALEGKMKTGNQNLSGGIASSMDLSLYNLSLSSSKEIEPPQNSSISSSVVSDALLKSQSKPSDPMDEGHFSEGPTVDESNREPSSSSSQNAAKSRIVEVHGEEPQEDLLPALSLEEKADTKKSHKCSKVLGGICNDLTSFFTHLVTGELQTIRNSDLEYVKELGSGTFGTVFYGKWKGSDVAIKRMKQSCFTEDSVQDCRLVSDFWKEAHMLGQLHHPNIVAFYGVVTDGPATNLATVTEYMVNGSLKQVLQRKDRTIDRRKRILIAMDAAFGMEYLHEKNIVHFDLKSHNFLVNMRDPQRPVCKIGDLGLSKIKKKTLISGGVRGTIPWMAPELLNSKNNLVTEKVDVYSFGIVMWELLAGEEPYKNLHSAEIIAGIIKGALRPEIPNWCDPTWRSLTERCWSSDPDSRPAFSDISKELRAMALTMNMK